MFASATASMDPPPPNYRLLRFFSDEHPPEQRLAIWREILVRKLLALDVEPLMGKTFQVDASLRVLPGLRIGVGIFGPSINRRTQEIVAADNDDIYALINLEGELVIAVGDAQFTLGEGDGCFLSCKQEGNFTRPAHGRLLCVRFDRATLAELVPNLDDCLGRAIREDFQSLRLMTVYMRALDHNQKLESDDLRALAIAHCYDLASAVLNPMTENAQPAREAGAGAARLRTIKKLVMENLDNADFAIADAASACQLSPRQMQRLFEAEDTTFSEFVLSKRLARVHAALTDRRQAHRSISEIAVARGFRDISQFNRAFRRRYGTSPSEVRQRGAA
jgi:AraC-like DNA-binding protein